MTMPEFQVQADDEARTASELMRCNVLIDEDGHLAKCMVALNLGGGHQARIHYAICDAGKLYMKGQG